MSALARNIPSAARKRLPPSCSLRIPDEKRHGWWWGGLIKTCAQQHFTSRGEYVELGAFSLHGGKVLQYGARGVHGECFTGRVACGCKYVCDVPFVTTVRCFAGKNCRQKHPPRDKKGTVIALLKTSESPHARNMAQGFTRWSQRRKCLGSPSNGMGRFSHFLLMIRRQLDENVTHNVSMGDDSERNPCSWGGIV